LGLDEARAAVDALFGAARSGLPRSPGRAWWRTGETSSWGGVLVPAAVMEAFDQPRCLVSEDDIVVVGRLVTGH